MVYGAKKANMPDYMKAGLAYFGVSTILFNAINYIRVEKDIICP